MILVVGAGGQLGSAAVRELRSRGMPVRAFLRRAELVRRFEQLGCEAALGDIANIEETRRAFRGATAAIATVNSAMPTRSSDTIERVEGEGYRNLYQAAVESGDCRQFILVSTTAASPRSPAALFRAKFTNEEALRKSGLGYTIFRFPAFLDVWIPMMGLARLVRPAENATIRREFGFASDHLKRIGDSIERKGVIHFAGDGETAHAAIAVDDCARLIAASVHNPGCLNRTLEITGPEAVTGAQIAAILERVLGKPLARKKTPAWMFSLLAFFLRSNPAAANLMTISRLSAVEPTPVTGQELARMLSVKLTAPEQWLLERLTAD